MYSIRDSWETSVSGKLKPLSRQILLASILVTGEWLEPVITDLSIKSSFSLSPLTTKGQRSLNNYLQYLFTPIKSTGSFNFITGLMRFLHCEFSEL